MSSKNGVVAHCVVIAIWSTITLLVQTIVCSKQTLQFYNAISADPLGFRYEEIEGAVCLAIHVRRIGLRTNNAKSPVRISILITSPKTGIQLPVAS
jgi:hypothetical protein